MASRPRNSFDSRSRNNLTHTACFTGQAVFYSKYIITNSTTNAVPDAPTATVRSDRRKKDRIRATTVPAMAEGREAVAKKMEGKVIDPSTA